MMRHCPTLAIAIAIAACSREAPVEMNPPPANVTMAPAAYAPPEIGYARQSATMKTGERVPYAVTLAHADGSPVRIAWQWLDKAGTPIGEPVLSNVERAPSNELRFEVVAPATAGDYLLKVWLAREDGASLEPAGTHPLHYGVRVD